MCSREKRENLKIVFEVWIESKIVLYKLYKFRLMSKAENAAKPILNFIKTCSKQCKKYIVSDKIQNFGNGETGVIISPYLSILSPLSIAKN